jgi:hypothetical protein
MVGLAGEEVVILSPVHAGASLRMRGPNPVVYLHADNGRASILVARLLECLVRCRTHLTTGDKTWLAGLGTTSSESIVNRIISWWVLLHIKNFLVTMYDTMATLDASVYYSICLGSILVIILALPYLHLRKLSSNMLSTLQSSIAKRLGKVESFDNNSRPLDDLNSVPIQTYPQTWWTDEKRFKLERRAIFSKASDYQVLAR